MLTPEARAIQLVQERVAAAMRKGSTLCGYGQEPAQHLQHQEQQVMQMQLAHVTSASQGNANTQPMHM